GAVVSHDAIGVAEAAEDIAVEEAGALHGLDHTGIAAILRAVHVVAGDARADRARPGEAHLARFDRGRERLRGIPTGPDTLAILLRRLDRALGPKEAGHQPEILVELLADIAVDAADDLVRAALLDLAHPIGIGEQLARHADEIGLALLQQSLGLGGIADLADGDHRRGVALGVDVPLDRRGVVG